MTLKVYSHVEFETVNFAPHPKAVFGYLAEAKSAPTLFLEKKLTELSTRKKNAWTLNHYDREK